MFSKLSNFTKTLWGRLTAFAVGAGAVLVLVDYLIKWKIYTSIVTTATLYVGPAFFADVTAPLYLVFPLVVVALAFVVLFIRDGITKEKYFIPIRSRFGNGSEPSEYSRRTKWKFKGVKSYYYIPLLSHSYNSVEFRDLCGPYCARCNHILHMDGGEEDMGNRFFCVNCVRRYKIPKELLGDYQNKLFAYFQEEYRQRRLREAE